MTVAISSNKRERENSGVRILHLIEIPDNNEFETSRRRVWTERKLSDVHTKWNNRYVFRQDPIRLHRLFLESGQRRNTICVLDTPRNRLLVSNSPHAPIAYRREKDNISAKKTDDAWNAQYFCRQDRGNTLAHYPKTVRCAEYSLRMILPDPPKKKEDFEKPVISK